MIKFLFIKFCTFFFFTAGIPGAQMSSYYNSAYGSAGFGSAMHAAAAAAVTSPTGTY